MQPITKKLLRTSILGAVGGFLFGRIVNHYFGMVNALWIIFGGFFGLMFWMWRLNRQSDRQLAHMRKIQQETEDSHRRFLDDIKSAADEGAEPRPRAIQKRAPWEWPQN